MTESVRKNNWNAKLEELKAFSALNKRWPSTCSEDAIEKDLGQWWSRQKYDLNKKLAKTDSPKPEDEKITIIKQLIESNASFERDGIWDKRYQMIVDKFKTDKKLWPYSTEDKEIQKCIRWWNQQKTFARKYKSGKDSSIMSQERFDKVAGLMRIMGQDFSEEPSSDKAASGL